MSLFGAVSALLHSSADRRAIPLPTTTVDPLPDYHRRGLIAVSTLALLSAVATLSMCIFMTVRLVFWRRFGNIYPGYNQYMILIYNLLIADLIQSCAFSLNLYWIATNRINSPSAVCAVQGLFVQLGDPGSGLFALAIAAHTFMQTVFGRKIEYKWFVTGILGIWGFMVVMCIIPIASHWTGPEPVFALTGAWVRLFFSLFLSLSFCLTIPTCIQCWINNKYEKDRLWTHYFWIFIAEFCTLILYGIIFIQLRRKIASSVALGNRHSNSLTRLTRITYLMVMYPIAYVVLSLPLAIGRMSTERGNNPSVTYFCVAGSMITSSGVCDVLMYTFTRRAITVEHHHHHHHNVQSAPAGAGVTSSALNPFHHYDYRSNHIATVVALTTFVPSPPLSPSQSRKKSSSSNNNTRRKNGGFSYFPFSFFFRKRGNNTSSVNNGNDESCESIARLKDNGQKTTHRNKNNKNNISETDLSRVYQETTIEVTSEPAYPAVDRDEERSLSLSDSSSRNATVGHFETME